MSDDATLDDYQPAADLRQVVEAFLLETAGEHLGMYVTPEESAHPIVVYIHVLPEMPGFVLLLTCGVSATAAQRGPELPGRVELALVLPADWPAVGFITETDAEMPLDDETAASFWPLQMLLGLGRAVQAGEFPAVPMTVVPAGDSTKKPFGPGSDASGVWVFLPLWDDAAAEVEAIHPGGEPIQVLQLLPLVPPEMDFLQAGGSPAELIDALEEIDDDADLAEVMAFVPTRHPLVVE
jgi:hypothetical protein